MDICVYSSTVVHIALYTDVSNATTLRQRIIDAALATGPEGDAEREAVNFAFIDARLVTSVLHLKTAIYHAILSQDSLRTKTIHSEILWVLNPTNNISEAIRRYGVSDTSTSLFVVHIAPQPLSDVQVKMNAVVQGAISPVSELETITDWAAVKKYHKLNTEPAILSAAGDTSREREVVDNIVVSSVAMKSIST